MSDFLNRSHSDDENWLPIADIMTSLFVIFLFIAIIAIQNVSKVMAVMNIKDGELDSSISILDKQAADLDSIRYIIHDLHKVKDEIYQDLKAEFKYDLPVWRAEIDPHTLVFRFNEPEILFQPSSAEIRPRFQEILSSFFPRYLRVLERYFSSIAEVKIEGHTSSEWLGAKTDNEAFSKNMELSQKRTQSVLLYSLSLGLLETQSEWIRKKVTANGFSSTRLKKNKLGQENKEASRRVEFRVYLNEEIIIKTIDGIVAYDGF